VRGDGPVVFGEDVQIDLDTGRAQLVGAIVGSLSALMGGGRP